MLQFHTYFILFYYIGQVHLYACQSYYALFVLTLNHIKIRGLLIQKAKIVNSWRVRISLFHTLDSLGEKWKKEGSKRKRRDKGKRIWEKWEGRGMKGRQRRRKGKREEEKVAKKH